jgi:glucose-6-phosphate 1-dehydrogenase
MVVSELLQVLGFVAMEPPTSLTARALVDEKVKVFASMPHINPAQVVRGQYDGYRAEPGVADDSETETFIALEAWIDNWRWEGVPFYLRTGKKLARGARILTLAFKRPPHRMFPGATATDDGNKLIFDLGDPGSITASFMAKKPGPTMELGKADLTFDYDRSFIADNELEAYQRLIHDALTGDHTLFTRADGIERLWEIATPFLQKPPPVQPYFSGSWGPDDVHKLISPRQWHLPDNGA